LLLQKHFQLAIFKAKHPTHPMATAKPKTIDEYIDQFPDQTQQYLEQIRKIIKKTAPKAEETISYGIAAFTLNKTYFIYFSGNKKHVSIYPAPKGSDTFNKQISAYRAGKGTIQFSPEEPLPVKLIASIVRQLMKANLERSKAKKR
jgi:uncharacterized protein YdhG (YjbR/CyaY superfamily)